MTSEPRWARRVAVGITDHGVAIAVATCVAAGVASAYLVARFDVDTDLRAVLPSDAPSVVGLDAANARFGALSPQWIVVRGGERAVRRRCAESLSSRLAARDDVAAVVHRVVIARAINPLMVELEESAFEAPPGFTDDGWLESDDALVMVVRLGVEPTDVLAGRALLGAVQRAHGEACEGSTAVEVVGSLAQRDHEVQVIERDMNVATAIAALLIGLYLLVRFRDPRFVAVLAVPLGLAVVVSLAVAHFAFGDFNLLTSVAVVLLLGLGVDSALHFLRDFSRGPRGVEGLARTVHHTGRAVVLAALTTVSQLVVLGTSDFDGFEQLGWVGALALAMVIVVATPLTLVGLSWARARARPVRMPTPRRAELGVAVAVAIAILGALGVARTRIDDSFRRFVLTAPEEERTADVLAATIDRTEIPAIVLVSTETPEDAATLVERLRRDAPATVAGVTYAGDFDGERWTRDLFGEKGPRAEDPIGGRTVFVVPAIDDLEGDELAAFARDLGAATEGLGPHIVASTAYILLDVQAGLRRETARLLPIALLVLVLVVLVTTRRVDLTLLAVLPVALGLLALAAGLWLTDTPLDMFNLAAILIVIGTGVDDGVHLATRFFATARRRADVVEVWSTTRDAVIDTSVTTTLGFASLLACEHAGLRSLGGAAAAGIVLTTVAALYVMPRVLWIALRPEVA